MVKVTLYICTSDDGFIADKTGGVGWLPPMGPEALANYERFFESVDLIILGSRSYEKVMSFGMDWPYAGKAAVVFTKRDPKELMSSGLGSEDVKFTADSPEMFVKSLESGSNGGPRGIWLMGGAQLIKSFVQAQLIDEIFLFSVPKLLGEGLPLGIELELEFNLVKECNIGDTRLREFVKK